MKPKILIVGRSTWTADHSTLCSIFEDYPANRLAYICIESKTPDFSKCANHFQLSELLMFKNLFNKKSPIANVRSIDKDCDGYKIIENQEGKIGKWFRRHRSSVFLYLREILWYITRWKGFELQKFIKDFAPDYLFFLSDPLPLMNRLERYVLEIANRPAAIYMMDDIWSYKNGRTLYRCLLRVQVYPLIKHCNVHFAISELMKREYDKTFKINSIILTKGVKKQNGVVKVENNKEPLKFLYAGQLLYGRDKTLLKVAETLHKMNLQSSSKAELHIYTQTRISEKQQQKFALFPSTIFHNPVPYSEVNNVLLGSHVVLFIESLENKYRNIAWLSFSTKITDYLQSGRCILAVGDAQIAPIEYLNRHSAAIVCDSYEKIEDAVRKLISNPQEIEYFAEKSYMLGQNKHSINIMQSRFSQMLEILSI